MFYSPDFGGDGNYELYRAQVFAYLPWKNFVLGGRVDTRAASGDVPFYQLPFIEMRGIPVARYQDEMVGLVEAELRWNFSARWALIASSYTRSPSPKRLGGTKPRAGVRSRATCGPRRPRTPRDSASTRATISIWTI